MTEILDVKKHTIEWAEIGSVLLQKIYKENVKLYDNYIIYNGLDTMYPCNWNKCVEEFINKPYNNYKNLIREFQPLVVLVRSVYELLESRTIDEFWRGESPLKYFIQKSLENLKLKDYDYTKLLI
jgi:hypothetical protein